MYKQTTNNTWNNQEQLKSQIRRMELPCKGRNNSMAFGSDMNKYGMTGKYSNSAQDNAWMSSWAKGEKKSKY